MGKLIWMKMMDDRYDRRQRSKVYIDRKADRIHNTEETLHNTLVYNKPRNRDLLIKKFF